MLTVLYYYILKLIFPPLYP